MLTKGKSLSTDQLGSLLMFDLAHTHLTCVFMLLGLHLDIVSREAPITMVLVEGTVAAVENVSFRVGQVWIGLLVDITVLASNVLAHERSTVSRVFTVKDQQRFGWLLMLKQLRGKLLLVIEVHSTLNVATLVFVLEATIYNDSLVVQAIILAIKYIYHGVT